MLGSQPELKLEPVKIIQIGKIESDKLIAYGTQLTPGVINSLSKTLFRETFLELASDESSDLIFQIPVHIGEGAAAAEVKMDYVFPRLKQIIELGTLVNLLDFYSEYIFDAVDWTTVTGAKSDLPDSSDLQRYWFLAGDLVWISRPCRSAEDYEYIKLKVEEFVLEKRDEYSALIRKVERLRKILDNKFHGSREFPTDDMLAFVMKRDGEKCVLCDSREFLQFDHIYPRSKGGSDETGNLRILCRTCNSKRGNLNS